MKFAVTLLLALAVVFPYYLLSHGTFYLADEELDTLSFGTKASPENYFTHLFTHVGLQHLIANLLPLLLFGLVFEAVAGGAHLLAVFLLSGILSSLVFTFFNPLVVLVGASTGVSGLMVAATVLKPKKGLVLLVATFVLLSLSPVLVAAYNDFQIHKLAEEKSALAGEIESLVEQNETQAVLDKERALEEVETRLVQTTTGIARERETPTDLLIHLLGATFGGVYVFVFLRKKLDSGLEEFSQLGEAIFGKVFPQAKPKNKS